MMAVLVLGQFAIADNGGHYVPRTQGNTTADSFMASLRVNQHTGLIDPALMLQAVKGQAKATAADDLYWISMGPDNMGGQTTAIVFSPENNQVYIGAKGGGVYKTYNFGVTWHQVGDQNLMVSCMVRADDGTIYVGTGDGDDAITHNGLDQQDYENSFVGTGIWKIKDDAFTQISSTVPSLNDVEAWSFVNDLAYADGKLFAATGEGLKYSADKGGSWTMLVEGNAIEVEALNDGTVMASVDGQLYLGTVEEMECRSNTGTSATYASPGSDTIIALPKAAGLLDIAIAPSNNDVMYASCVNGSGVHAGIYVSYDKGTNWFLILPAVTANLGTNNVYSGVVGSSYTGFGLYNHGMVVDPNDEGRLFILGYYLWKLEKPTTTNGYYLAEQLTGESYYYLEDYVHVGLHAMAFNPEHSDECYIGSDGGVYKGTGTNGSFTFSYCNRNYVTTRMFNVAYSGKDTRVLAGGLDHGVVLIKGDENLNSINHGDWVNYGGLTNGLFSDDYHAGPCAISNINPNTIFVTYKDGALYRSETAGEDWVSVNFTSSSTLNSGNGISTSSFRMPILLYENFEDDNNLATVWLKNTDTLPIPSHTTVQLMSNNNFPFDYTLSHTLQVGDSIEVHDPISAKFYMAYTDVLYMTNKALDFAVETPWYLLSKKGSNGVTGEPLCMAISADGDNLFIGTKAGRLFRVSNLNTVVDEASGTMSDTTGAFQVTTTEITLPTNGQCVTSVAVDPRDANKIVVTLGNYGNDTYVLYSTNALSDEPTLVSKQGNLPKMPVYSSLIAYDYHSDSTHVGNIGGPVFMLGTEHGIYTSDNLNSWASNGYLMGDVPVMELKQQLLEWDDQIETNVTDEGTFTTVYPGVHNKGVIYAATYGRGVFRCENYKQHYDAVPENSQTVVASDVVIYPNPVSSNATISFEVNGTANVSYQVYDLMGRMVMSQTLGRYNQGNYEVNVNMSDLSAGAYILRLNQDSNSSCTRFVVY